MGIGISPVQRAGYVTLSINEGLKARHNLCAFVASWFDFASDEDEDVDVEGVN